MASDTYNKMFTMHGIIMVFLFLVPSVPATIGNFVMPIMVGAKDLAFPKINLLSWYLYIVGGIFTVAALVLGGVDTGWTFTTPLSHALPEYARGHGGAGHLHCRVQFHLHRPELHRHDPPHARAGHDLVPPAALQSGRTTRLRS